DKQGAIWVGSASEGLFRLTTTGSAATVQRFVHSSTDAASISNDRVRALLVDRRGVLWVGTDSGLDRRDPSNATRAPCTHYTATANAPSGLGLIDTPVTALHEDLHGRLWIGSLPGISAFDSARTTI